MPELWGMWSISSLPLLPGPLWTGEVVPVRVLSMAQIELWYLKDVQRNVMLIWIVGNRTVCKLVSDVQLNR